MSLQLQQLANRSTLPCLMPQTYHLSLMKPTFKKVYDAGNYSLLSGMGDTTYLQLYYDVRILDLFQVIPFAIHQILSVLQQKLHGYFNH